MKRLTALTFGIFLAFLAGAQVTTSPTTTGIGTNLATQVTGTLSPANGGTGVANNAAATLTRSGNHALTVTTSGTASLNIGTGGTLGTAAYTAATAYATSAQGTTADNAMPKAGGTFTGNVLFTDNTYDIGASGATRPRDLFLSRNIVAGGSVTPSQTGGVVGTTTNNNADAGSVGELLTAAVASGSAVSMTNGAQVNIVSVSLTAGDWDVQGIFISTPAATTSIGFLAAGISTSSATLGGDGTYMQMSPVGVPGGNLVSYPTPVVRLSLAATTTVYLVGQCGFSVSTMSGYGTIRARRVR